jgi:hypothetical protein
MSTKLLCMSQYRSPYIAHFLFVFLLDKSVSIFQASFLEAFGDMRFFLRSRFRIEGTTQFIGT